MKASILALIASLSFSFNASATSPVLPPETALLQAFIGGGMPVPGGLGSMTITVHDNGLVESLIYRYAKDFNNVERLPAERQELGHVLPQDLAAIKDAVAGLKGGTFVTPNTPQCMDAPGYTYGIVKERFFTAVYRRQGCRDLELKDKSQRAAALSIKNFLDLYIKMAR